MFQIGGITLFVLSSWTFLNVGPEVAAMECLGGLLSCAICCPNVEVWNIWKCCDIIDAGEQVISNVVTNMEKADKILGLPREVFIGVAASVGCLLVLLVCLVCYCCKKCCCRKKIILVTQTQTSYQRFENEHELPGQVRF